MINTESFIQHLAAWKQAPSPVIGAHLDDATFYQLTAQNALAATKPENLRHLSLCPDCMANWADWRRARDTAETAQAASTELTLAYGFLQAAASPELTDSVSMQSQCGSYRLDILAQEGSATTGLVIFEALNDRAQREEALVTIRDRGGRLLLKGHLRDGRLARPVDNPAQFDLSTWTVSIETDHTDQT